MKGTCMTLREALEKEIRFVRKPAWANPDDRLELPLLGNGQYGPWCTLHSPAMKRIADASPDAAYMAELAEQKILIFNLNLDEDGWEPAQV